MRNLVASLVIAFACGCRMASPSPAPTGLTQRLDAIESFRLSQPRTAAGPVAHVQAPAYDPSRQILSLTDIPVFHDPPGYQTPDETGGAPAETASSGGAYERVGPLPSFWETLKRDVKAAPRDLWRDTKRVYANPVNLVILGTAYGGSLALQHGVDDHIEDHFNEYGDGRPAHHHFKEDWRDAFGAIGNPGTHFALAGVWYLVGQQRMDDKTYEVGKTLFSALAINGVTVMLGQAATFDDSPNGEYGTFPSGHTSSSFVVASVLHEAYGHAVGIPLYALAALAGHERIEDGEHYFSDVAMGAVLGTVIGHSVASGRDPEFFGWKLVPFASTQGGSGLALMKTFE